MHDHLSTWLCCICGPLHLDISPASNSTLKLGVKGGSKLSLIPDFFSRVRTPYAGRLPQGMRMHDHFSIWLCCICGSLHLDISPASKPTLKLGVKGGSKLSLIPDFFSWVWTPYAGRLPQGMRI